jgi:hypothetical protein
MVVSIVLVSVLPIAWEVIAAKLRSGKTIAQPKPDEGNT